MPAAPRWGAAKCTATGLLRSDGGARRGVDVDDSVRDCVRGVRAKSPLFSSEGRVLGRGCKASAAVRSRSVFLFALRLVARERTCIEATGVRRSPVFACARPVTLCAVATRAAIAPSSNPAVLTIEVVDSSHQVGSTRHDPQTEIGICLRKGPRRFVDHVLTGQERHAIRSEPPPCLAEHHQPDLLRGDRRTLQVAQRASGDPTSAIDGRPNQRTGGDEEMLRTLGLTE